MAKLMRDKLFREMIIPIETCLLEVAMTLGVKSLSL